MKDKSRMPLSGLRVVEFGQIAAGPFAGSLFADLGADVVKVENPSGGDGMRSWPPISTRDEVGFSENFASINRNKRSIALDLKSADDIARVKRLCAKADVMIENFRPGVLAKLGLGYDEIRAANQRIVYCSISGYGQSGPYSSKGAFDVTVQAISGLMSVTGTEGAAPIKCGVPVGDFCAGLYGAFASLAAVTRARQTGVGAMVDCSMLSCLLGVAALQTSEFFGTGRTPMPLGSAHPRNAPYQAFKAKDCHFVVAAGNDALWRKVADAVGMPELVDDERFRTIFDRARNQAVLADILEQRFAAQPARHWLAILDGLGVPCAPINTYPEILSDPHVEHARLVRELTLPNGVSTRTLAFPVAISGYDFAVYREPPALGAHNEEVFSEWIDAGATPAGKSL